MKKIICVGYMATFCVFASDTVSSKEVAEGVCASPACESLAVLSTGFRSGEVSPEASRWQASRRSYSLDEIRAAEQRSLERIKRVFSTSN